MNVKNRNKEHLKTILLKDIFSCLYKYTPEEVS